ncbi:threonylcarbamoyl-AMP synthase [Candidatus Woesearchaeota archaeon]|nr:MAG: tRNA threonylcarbamoyladenosine biosynthesis protein [archaeon GW2011_AR18]MBS3161256.1 threonylcarbamoyl-AMP synthase [Candidatus Woesearchaeota archaeon]HIH26327.1 threonylcarbamoyl-AMP synthase [Nanoarchaeota archaeon]
MSSEILKNKIVIYPTDTIYGIGCYALDDNLVKNIKDIKKRDSSKPFSVIVNKKWIKDNCFTNKMIDSYIKKLPGKYTFILKLKNKKAISKEVNNDSDTVGVRIPDNSFTKKLPIPFVTTSVNVSGEPPIVDTSQISSEIRSKVDLIIEGGILNNKPSKVYDLTKEKPIRLR